MNGAEKLAKPYRSLVNSLVELIKTEYGDELVSVAVFGSSRYRGVSARRGS
jgi:hypothetical protein